MTFPPCLPFSTFVYTIFCMLAYYWQWLTALKHDKKHFTNLHKTKVKTSLVTKYMYCSLYTRVSLIFAATYNINVAGCQGFMEGKCLSHLFTAIEPHSQCTHLALQICRTLSGFQKAAQDFPGIRQSEILQVDFQKQHFSGFLVCLD